MVRLHGRTTTGACQTLSVSSAAQCGAPLTSFSFGVYSRSLVPTKADPQDSGAIPCRLAWSREASSYRGCREEARHGSWCVRVRVLAYTLCFPFHTRLASADS